MERVALSRAVRWHIENRILLYGKQDRNLRVTQTSSSGHGFSRAETCPKLRGFNP